MPVDSRPTTTHYKGPDGYRAALCGKEKVLCTGYRSDVTCELCRKLIETTPEGESPRPTQGGRK